MKQLINQASPPASDQMELKASGEYGLMIEGTLSGATVALEIQLYDTGAWVAVTSKTAEGFSSVGKLPAGATVKAGLSGGTPSGVIVSFGGID